VTRVTVVARTAGATVSPNSESDNKGISAKSLFRFSRFMENNPFAVAKDS
jgi:hypothetical protein